MPRGDTIYLLIEAEGGHVRRVEAFRRPGEAVDCAVEVARGDGLFEDQAVTEDDFRKRLAEEGYYDDCGVRTTLTSAFLADDPGRLRD